MIHWNIDPELLSLGPIHIKWYGLMFLAGFSLGFRFFTQVCLREGFSTDKLDSGLIKVVLGTIIGARLFHCLFYDPEYYFANPARILAVWEGGLASHGGGLGVLVALWLFTRQNPEFKLLWIFDRMAIPTVMTGGFIRIGNLMNSEILGLPTNASWGVVFERIDKIPRHPAMVYESICYFIIFAMTYWMYWNWDRIQKPVETTAKKKKKELMLPPEGFLFGTVIALIFLARFFIEYFKENQEAFKLGMSVNMGQLLSVPFILVGLYFVIRSFRLKPAT